MPFMDCNNIQSSAMDLTTNRCQEDKECRNVAQPQTSYDQKGRQENKQEHPKGTRSTTRTAFKLRESFPFLTTQ